MSGIGGIFDPAGRPLRRFCKLRAVLISFAFALFGIGLIWIERAALLDSIGRMWVVSDQLKPADAAAVLGGGEDTRPPAAAQLYKAGLVKRITVSNAGVTETSTDNPNRDQLLKLGIPAAAISAFGHDPQNTFEEARALADWAKQNHARQIIVPAEIFTSRRFQWILSRELNKVGVRVTIEVAPTSYNLDNWWWRKDGVGSFETEVIKYAYYRLAYWWS